jgi:hypothetical protein
MEHLTVRELEETAVRGRGGNLVKPIDALVKCALWGAVCLTGIALPAAPAHAFCGFYVSGADAKLFNNATQVALMREGTRTVLSMQNNYQGPSENFALMIPVPAILH